MKPARHSDTEIHVALEHAPVGVLIVDSAGAVPWANAAAALVLGTEDRSALHRTPVFSWLREPDRNTFRQWLGDHFRVPGDERGVHMHPFDLTAADGSTLRAELTLAPLADAGNGRAVLFIQSMARQITAERRFSQIFDNLPLGLIVVDARQRIVQTNASLSAIFGHAPEALVGQPLDTLLPERYREAHREHFRGYARAPTSRMMGSGRDLTGLHRSGQEIPVEIALTRLENEGQPRFLAIVTDISGRKRSESALQQTNAQLEEFTYVASHDLRSPLRGIGDLVTWIRDDLGDDTLPPEILHNFDRVALRIARCEKMIDDLLRYARAGVRDLHMEPVDPRALIEEATAMATIPDGFAVEVEVAGGALTAPPAPLFASLRNLIANAVKHHGRESGRIRITMREEGRFSIFTVEDDGQGIAPGTEERIFKLFHRASPGTEGDGVGLAFTRRMINAHGGMITVEGKGPLGGARFEIHWPRILLREFDDA